MNDGFDFTFGEDMSLDSIIAELKAEGDFAPPSASAYPEEYPEAPSPSSGTDEVPEEETGGMNHIVYDSSEQAIGVTEDEQENEEPPENGGKFVSFTRREPTAAEAFKQAVYKEEPEPPVEEKPEPEREPDAGGSEQPDYEEEPKLSRAERRARAREQREQEREAQDVRTAEERRPQQPTYRDKASEERYNRSAGAETHVYKAYSDPEEQQYASQGDYENYEEYPEEEYEREPDFRDKLLAPLINLISAAADKRQEKLRKQAMEERRNRKAEPPELKPGKASMFYASQSHALRLRSIIATALTVVLIYLSYNLPAFGLLGDSPSIRELVCLVLELAVMITGLDIMTNGLTTLCKGKPGAESLITVSCIVTALDALVMALTKKIDVGLPFCGASALSVVFALWGQKLSCDAFSLSFATAARAKDPNVVMSVSGIDEDGCILAKFRRPVTGFVRTAETADIFEDAYRMMSPILLISSLVLSLFCFIASDKCTDFLHTLAACMAGSASLSAIFGFALPFWTLTKRLARSGVAIAGCWGAAELGRIKRLIVTDTDIFPPRTLSIVDVAMSEGAHPRVTIAYTGSVIAAAGLGIAPTFTELMRKNGCTMQRIENFACHEGGGLVARINGDQVNVGSASFIELMGTHLPKSQVKGGSTIYTAINGSLAGIFTVNYKPVATVQRAMVSLMREKVEPLFAIRDFSITPFLIKQKFKLPSKNLDFPSFADRYRISSRETEEEGTVIAMFARGGISSVAGLVSRGRRLYNAARLILVLSLISSVLIPVIMLALCWSGSYDSASCGNLMSYMLLCQVPVFIISMGLKR